MVLKGFTTKESILFEWPKSQNGAKNQTMDAFKITHQRTGFLSVLILCTLLLDLSPKSDMRLKKDDCLWLKIYTWLLHQEKPSKNIWRLSMVEHQWRQSNTNLTVMSTVIRNGVLQKQIKISETGKTSELWWQQRKVGKSGCGRWETQRIITSPISYTVNLLLNISTDIRTPYGPSASKVAPHWGFSQS